MVLGLTKTEIKEVLDRDVLEDLCAKYDEQYEGCPQFSGAVALNINSPLLESVFLDYVFAQASLYVLKSA